MFASLLADIGAPAAAHQRLAERYASRGRCATWETTSAQRSSRYVHARRRRVSGGSAISAGRADLDRRPLAPKASRMATRNRRETDVFAGISPDRPQRAQGGIRGDSTSYGLLNTGRASDRARPAAAPRSRSGRASAVPWRTQEVARGLVAVDELVGPAVREDERLALAGPRQGDSGDVAAVPGRLDDDS